MAERKNTYRLPHIACEIASRGVAAARSEGKHRRVAATHTRALPEGALTPVLNGENVQDAAALSSAIEQAVTAVGGRGQEIIAVLPDSAMRVTLLDFDSLPERKQEAEATIRFRMRKSLPFDVDKAAISFDVQPAKEGVRVTAAIILHTVLEEYESAFRAAGCSPGVVLPSSLAALGAVNESHPTMLLKIGADASPVAVVQGDKLLLYRLLEGTGTVEPTAERIAEDVYPSLVYFQDNYGEPVEKLLVSGVADLDRMSATLEEQTGTSVRQLIDSDIVTASVRNEFAGAIGALL
jgi:type IV pilus assembly protein PilM